MNTFELKAKIENTPIVNKIGYIFSDENSKQAALSNVNFMIDLLGNHEIPKSKYEYVSLMDSVLGEDSDETDKEIEIQLWNAGKVIWLSK